MKLCVIGTGFEPMPPNGPGAIERLVFDLSSALLRRFDCEIHFIDIKSTNRQRINPKIKYHLIKSPKYKGKFMNHFFCGLIFAIKSAFMLAKLHRKYKFDVVHAHNQYSGLTILLVCKILRIPFVFTSHNQDLIANSFFKRIKHFATYFIITTADYVTVPTPTIQKIYHEKYHLKNVQQLFWGVDVSLNKNINWNRDKNLIMCVARLVPRKRQDTLIKAMSLVIKKKPHAKLVLIGPIDNRVYYNNLLNLINNFKLEKNILFAGAVSNKELYDYYRKAWVFCLASDNEHQGLVLLESMIFGTPVVVSDIGPFLDVVNLDKDIALVNKVGDYEGFGNSILMLLNNNKRRNKMSRASFKFVNKNFSWDTICTKAYTFYEEILNESNRSM